MKEMERTKKSTTTTNYRSHNAVRESSIETTTIFQMINVNVEKVESNNNKTHHQ